MTYSTLEVIPAQVVYQPDESIPAGTTKVSVTPYNGYKVVVYRNLYDGNGDLISSTQESMNTYRRRDKVILYNPADAGSLGIETGGTGTPTTPPEETTPPPETTPPVTPPVETDPPVTPTAPVETNPPAETDPPVTPTETPAPSPEPGNTPDPSPSPNPEPTEGV